MQSLKDLGLPGGKVGSWDHKYSEKDTVHQQKHWATGRGADHYISHPSTERHYYIYYILLSPTLWWWRGTCYFWALCPFGWILQKYFCAAFPKLIAGLWWNFIDEDKSNLGILPAISYYVFMSVSATRVAPHDLTENDWGVGTFFWKQIHINIDVSVLKRKQQGLCWIWGEATPGWKKLRGYVENSSLNNYTGMDHLVKM